jgi:hypothetical protein
MDEGTDLDMAIESTGWSLVFEKSLSDHEYLFSVIGLPSNQLIVNITFNNVTNKFKKWQSDESVIDIKDSWLAPKGTLMPLMYQPLKEEKLLDQKGYMLMCQKAMTLQTSEQCKVWFENKKSIWNLSL